MCRFFCAPQLSCGLGASALVAAAAQLLSWVASFCSLPPTSVAPSHVFLCFVASFSVLLWFTLLSLGSQGEVGAPSLASFSWLWSSHSWGWCPGVAWGPTVALALCVSWVPSSPVSCSSCSALLLAHAALSVSPVQRPLAHLCSTLQQLVQRTLLHFCAVSTL